MFIKKINAYTVGLVFKNGALVRILNEGYNFVMPTDDVYVYDITKPFNPPIELSLLLQNEALKEMLHVVEVTDGKIALMFESGFFKRVLTAGKYAFWKGVVEYNFTMVDLSKVEITEQIEKAVLMRTEVLYYVRVQIVGANEKGLLYIDNRFVQVLEPGVYYYWKNSTPLTVVGVDTRLLLMEIAGQEILTKDKAALRINFSAQYRVTDVVKAIVESKDYEKQLYTQMQLALREYISAYTLDELLERKDAIAPFVMNAITDKATALGLEVSACGIKDIILPGDMKEILNKVLIAEKQAQANTIMRREETAATRSLLNTAKLMEENAMLYKLKEMEYVERIAEKVNSISVSGSNQVLEQLKQIFSPPAV